MFTHLHVHTEFSLLDGLSKLDSLVNHAVDLNMHSLAITDHGGMYGAIDFYQSALKSGIKPIIGCEMYMAPKSRHDRNPNEKSPFHMTVLAQNNKGYENLVKMVSKSHIEGYYYKPRIDREVLEQHSDGIIVLSGCPSGEIPKAISSGNTSLARETATWYRELLGDRYFLELMNHGDVAELPEINKGLMEIHSELGIPVVATNDSHYTKRDEAYLQDLLLCIQTNTNVNDEKRLRLSEDSYYLKSSDEMNSLWPEVPQAISNTEIIAEMCELKLDFNQLRLPQYPVPESLTADEYLANICWEGLENRNAGISDLEKQRLKYELEVIRQTQFANYFLVVWDIARFVRQEDILFAVRGSAAASLVLFCLGVTNVNPLKYALVFERFLNVERKEMPDIDMDFQDDRREEVINYVVNKYGREHVAQIITFGTLGAKAALRDTGRALGMSYGDVDRIARLVPTKLGITLGIAKEQTPELREIYESEESATNLIDTAQKLEGTTRHISTHAAAVVISQQPLDDVVPLNRPTRDAGNGVAMTQYSMEPCADLGLLKMDFLGLSNLSIIAKARELIANRRGQDFELVNIPLDDSKTFDLLSQGDTVGVFQMEGSGMTRYIKELKPTSVEDVAAMIALYRPGPMEHITTFIASKHGESSPNYPHPALKAILEETYGVIVYQDQVLQIARTFAGYSLGEADIVRKAMGKKIPAIMAEEKDKFITGALAQGYTETMASQIFALIEPFAGYAFNKAHSVSYGLITYWTAYLKANHTAEYMVSLLNTYSDNTDKVASAILECRRIGIDVRLPSVKYSEVDYCLEDIPNSESAIRIGLSAIKNVGVAAAFPLVQSRNNDDLYSSIENFCQSADLSSMNKKGMESLIKCGAFDEFGDRTALLELSDRILALAHSEAKLRDSSQASMFDIMEDLEPASMVTLPVSDAKTSDADRSKWEQEMLGVSLSSNILLRSMLAGSESEIIIFTSELNETRIGQKIFIRGQISDVNQRYSRNGNPFVTASLTLMDGSVDIFYWDEKLESEGSVLEEGKLVSITGTLRERDGTLSVSCDTVEEFVLSSERPETDFEGSESINTLPVRPTPTNAQKEKFVQPKDNILERNGRVKNSIDTEVKHTSISKAATINIRIRESDDPEQDSRLLVEVKNVLMDSTYEGSDNVLLEISSGSRLIAMEWPMVQINACPALQEELQEVLGHSGNVRLS